MKFSVLRSRVSTVRSVTKLCNLSRKGVCVAFVHLGNWPIIRQYDVRSHEMDCLMSWWALSASSFPLMANSSHQQRRPTGSLFLFPWSFLAQGVWALYNLWDYMLAHFIWSIFSISSHRSHLDTSSGAFGTLLWEQCLCERVISNCNWKFSH